MRTVSAINNADTCITSLVNVEDAAMTSDFNVRDVRGQPVPFRKEAEALLKARHDELGRGSRIIERGSPARRLRRHEASMQRLRPRTSAWSTNDCFQD